MRVVADAVDAIVGHVQPNQGVRRPCVCAALQDDDQFTGFLWFEAEHRFTRALPRKTTRVAIQRRSIHTSITAHRLGMFLIASRPASTMS